MRAVCEAIIENPAQRENLRQCINILGGVPVIHRDKIVVDYEGEKIDAMVKLFEQYVRHRIRVTD